MSIQYKFKSLTELAEYLNSFGKSARDRGAQAITEKEKRIRYSEAAAWEAAARIVEQSTFEELHVRPSTTNTTLNRRNNEAGGEAK